MVARYRYFLIYKPFGMLSQFTREVAGQSTLAQLDFTFPKDIYPVGRLDKDSEGLLLLTNDGQLNKQLLHPDQKHTRTYLVQVEGIPLESDLQLFSKGMDIKHQGKRYTTLPAKADIMKNPPELPERNPPIRYRQSIPTTWLQITLTEGKNRQVRKMCAAVGYPVLRLVRIKIESLSLPRQESGLVLELTAKEVRNKLFGNRRG